MIDFPTATTVHRRLPKEAFYKHLPLTKVLKDKFVSDVDRIIVENSLTKENLNLTADSEIKEILLLSITLKKQEFDGKVIEAIARQNPHKLVFLLMFEGSRQLALYHSKLYRTQWMEASEVNLKPHVGAVLRERTPVKREAFGVARRHVEIIYAALKRHFQRAHAVALARL